MNSELLYKNRYCLFQFLIDEFGFKVIEEKYESKSFGNFFITLESPKFLLRYVCDRLVLSIEIANNLHRDDFLPLFILRNFIYNAKDMHKELTKNSLDEIKILNKFISSNYNDIVRLYSKENYLKTIDTIRSLLKEQSPYKFDPPI